MAHLRTKNLHARYSWTEESLPKKVNNVMLFKDATIKRKNIDWEEYYGKKFKLVYTPKGKQTGKWTKNQISIVTPTNEKAWEEWPEVSKEDYLRFKNNWRNMQKNLSEDKYLQITETNVMQFNNLVNRLLLEQEINVNQLAKEFYEEFLSKHQSNHVGSHNCAWATQEFIRWAKTKGVQAQAMYFVWQDENVVAKLKNAGILGPGFANAGESHIAPVVKNKIIDFTYAQFDNNFDQPAKITNVADWQGVYGKYGYGSRQINIGGRNTPVIVDDFDNIKNIKEIGGISAIYASKPLTNKLKANIKMPRLNKGAGMAGLAGLTSLMSNELPPDAANRMTRGGLGIKGKFEAMP